MPVYIYNRECNSLCCTELYPLGKSIIQSVCEDVIYAGISKKRVQKNQGAFMGACLIE